MINRRKFIGQVFVTAASTMGLMSTLGSCHSPGNDTPTYLKAYSNLYAGDPHKAALAWFKDARYGLFMHYGLYSIWGRGAWVQLFEKIPVAEYVKLKHQFTAEKFDADFITDLAIESGMKYVNITAKHHDGFCLFNTGQTDYSSVNAAAKRDLVGELAKSCEKKGLGLFLYYSIAADWHHPYFCAPEAGWQYSRPAYAEAQPAYLYRTEKDFEKYIAYARAQIKELVTQYHPAGIWFDPAMGFYSQARLFPMEEIYGEIRSLNPSTLISFKQGATGTEDFAAPERKATSLHEKVRAEAGNEAAELAQQVWQANENKHNETCSTLQHGAWSYEDDSNGKHQHLEVEEVLGLVKDASDRDMNLLLNTGPLPDGSIHPKDVATLRKVGEIMDRKI
jgi:alpha-L-fucosidase